MVTLAPYLALYVPLTLKPNAEPILRPPKLLPIELRESVKLELDRLVNAGVLTPVDQSTDWVNQMAIATKKDGSLRIYIDTRSLNLALKREHYPLPVHENILLDLAKAKVFSKVDLSHGYWHCTLEEESSLLTTFSTPSQIWEVPMDTPTLWTLCKLGNIPETTSSGPRRIHGSGVNGR